MFKKIRVAILLYLLAFVAIGNFLAGARSTDWKETLWVDVYPINADGSERTQAYIDSLSANNLVAIEAYFAKEAERYGVALNQPFRLELGPQIDSSLPELATTPSMLNTIVWSLRMRWFASRVDAGPGRPTPDIKLFALYYDEIEAVALDRSTALERGLIAIARLYAGRFSQGPNQVVMAHELLHTLGASDKYDLATNFPIYPHGFADPKLTPRYPQKAAELMAGRIPLANHLAEMPTGLSATMVGPATALEIGWPASHP
jgi:hypothetical protein